MATRSVCTLDGRPRKACFHPWTCCLGMTQNCLGWGLCNCWDLFATARRVLGPADRGGHPAAGGSALGRLPRVLLCTRGCTHHRAQAWSASAPACAFLLAWPAGPGEGASVLCRAVGLSSTLGSFLPRLSRCHHWAGAGKPSCPKDTTVLALVGQVVWDECIQSTLLPGLWLRGLAQGMGLGEPHVFITGVQGPEPVPSTRVFTLHLR